MAKTATNTTAASADSQVTVIPEEALGEFNIPDYTQQLYKQIFYSIREQLGFRAKNNLGEDFTWDSFKAKFAEVFGPPDEPLYSLEQLLAYAQKKFGMNQQDLIEANQRSWERRRQQEQRQQRQQQEQSSADNGHQTVPQEHAVYMDDIPY